MDSDAGIEDAQEFGGQSLPTGFVPTRRLVYLEIGLRAEEYIVGHPNRWRSRSRTSSQGSADAGSRPCLARRRSISALCVSVIGNGSGSAAMLSQRSSASWMRSGTLSLSKSSKETFAIKQDYRSVIASSTGSFLGLFRRRGRGL